jgi:hypothetical protein
VRDAAICEEFVVRLLPTAQHRTWALISSGAVAVLFGIAVVLYFRGVNSVTNEPLLPVSETIVAEMVAKEAQESRTGTEATRAQNDENVLGEKADQANQAQENAPKCPGFPPSRSIVLDTSWQEINPDNCDVIIAVIKGTMLFEFGDGSETKIASGQKLLPRFDKVFKRARAASGQAEMYVMHCPPAATDPSDGTWSCGRR